jgi:hypothetical protein
MEGYRGMTDTTTGKNLIATKIYDTDCEICKHMSKHDRATFEGFEQILYQEVKLDDIISHDNNLTKLRIYQCLERYCLSPTYEIDLPVYLLLSKKGDYIGHLQGALTIQEIRDGVKSMLTTPSE